MAGTGGKSRKAGKKKDWCKVYAVTKKREQNKLKILKKHLKKFPTDKSALAAVDTCNIAVRGYK